MRAGSTREEFCARRGLDSERPIIFYMCSSAFICPHEVGFVRRWLAALRAHSDPTLRSANVVVRPHPAHGMQWVGVSLPEPDKTVIWPPTGAAPLDEERKQDYFDTLFHAACVVGVNTSGFLEASIIGRRTLSLRPAEFPESQDGTLHFRYLVSAGIVTMAEQVPTHLAQLAEVLGGASEPDAHAKRFVEEFLRPHGIETPCTPILAAALERLAAEGHRRPIVPPFLAPLVRTLALPLAARLRRLYLARILRRPPRVSLAVLPSTARNAQNEQLGTKS
jgi:hypothetical protein